jgi:hypothetical protein
MAFGGSGHAFLINVHAQLCPSGPYCWKTDAFLPLVRNLGIEMTDLGFFHPGSTPQERAAVEGRIRENLDRGVVCSLLNMENQLITGYDDTRLFTARPWECTSQFPPATLTFGTWAEIADETHVSFFELRPMPRADDGTIVREALRYAVSLFRAPREHSLDDYGIGPDAYDLWEQAIPDHGATHGNWWNAAVWSECREMAAAFFAQVAEGEAGECADRARDLARDLARDYGEIATLLGRAGDKEMPAADKAGIVRDLKSRELAAIERVEGLLSLLA